MEEDGSALKIVTGKTSLGRPWLRWEEDNWIGLKEKLSIRGIGWIRLRL